MKIARVTGWLAAACVAILLADSLIALRRTPRDDSIVKTLQQQVKSDASAAPKLAAEQKRVTDARRSRKARDNAISWVLIGAATIFFLFVKKEDWPARSAKPSLEEAGRTAAPKPPQTLEAPSIDLAFVDDLVAQTGRDKDAAIPILQAIQEHYRYLPDEALRRVCQLTEITASQISGTSSFYGQFRRSPVGKRIVRVCHGTACHVAGARQVTDELRRHLQIPAGADTDAAREFTIEEVACLGCCSLAPVVMVDGRTAGRLTPAKAPQVLEQ
jgi:NADH:ubiquinone oxidoreductase subunit E